MLVFQIVLALVIFLLLPTLLQFAVLITMWTFLGIVKTCEVTPKGINFIKTSFLTSTPVQKWNRFIDVCQSWGNHPEVFKQEKQPKKLMNNNQKGG